MDETVNSAYPASPSELGHTAFRRTNRWTNVADLSELSGEVTGGDLVSLGVIDLTYCNAMPFFTRLSYYRPCPPPPVTADQLSRFIAAICDTNTLTDGGFRWLNVKFGESIDQDDKGTACEEETAPGVSVIHDIDWDVDLSNDPTHHEMMGAGFKSAAHLPGAGCTWDAH